MFSVVAKHIPFSSSFVFPRVSLGERKVRRRWVLPDVHHPTI